MIASISTCLISQQMKLCPGARDDFSPSSIVDEKDWLTRTANLQVRMEHPQTINAIPLFALIQNTSEDKSSPFFHVLVTQWSIFREHLDMSHFHPLLKLHGSRNRRLPPRHDARNIRETLTQHTVRRFSVSKPKSAC